MLILKQLKGRGKFNLSNIMPFKESEFEKPKTGAEVRPEEEKPEEGQLEEEAAKQPEKPEGTAEKSAEKKELTEAEIEKRYKERKDKLGRIFNEAVECFYPSLGVFGGARPEISFETKTGNPALNSILEKMKEKDKEINEEREQALSELKKREKEEADIADKEAKEDIARRLEEI